MNERECLACLDENENVWIIQKYGQNLEVKLKNGETWAVRINHDWHGEYNIPIEVLDWIHRRGL